MLNELSELLLAIRPEELSPEVIEKTKTIILNFVGGSLPGADADIVAAERAFWDAQGCTGSCTVLGQKGKTAPVAAASINSSMGQVFLQEDCHDSTISHPGTIVVPTALAVGQSVHASGAQVIAAVVAGYEAMGRIGHCLIRPGFCSYGLRPASILAPFGVCAAAGCLLKLTPEELTGALGIAGNSAVGIMEFANSGTADICIQNSAGAKIGVVAAYEAKYGLRGAPSILDGKFGLGRAYNRDDCDWSGLAKAQSEPEIMEVFIKPYPCCGHDLPAAQAAVELFRTGKYRPEDIASAVIGTRQGGKDYPGCDNKGPFSGTISAMTSQQFIVASGLLFGKVTASEIKRFADAEIASLARRIDLVVDPEVNKEGGARLTVRLKNGEELTYRQKSTPVFSDAGVRERVRQNAVGYFTAEQAEQLIAAGEQLEKLKDICEFADLMERHI